MTEVFGMVFSWDTLFHPCSFFFWHRNSLLIFSEGHPNAGQLRYKITRPRELWESRGIWRLVQQDLLNNRRSDPQNRNPSVRSVLSNVRVAKSQLTFWVTEFVSLSTSSWTCLSPSKHWSDGMVPFKNKQKTGQSKSRSHCVGQVVLNS